MSQYLQIHDWIISHPWSTTREIGNTLSMSCKKVYDILYRWMHDGRTSPSIVRRVRLGIRYSHEYSIVTPFYPPKEGAGYPDCVENDPHMDYLHDNAVEQMREKGGSE